MGAFGWLQEALEQQQQSGCETTREAEKFVCDYDKQLAAAKQVLWERQAKEREKRSTSQATTSSC